MAVSCGPDHFARYGVVLVRSVSHSRALNCLHIFQCMGQPAVNPLEVATVCGDKVRTSQALSLAGIPSPVTAIAYTPEVALQALERIGYPAVLKPAVGSWGHLISKVNNRDAAEAVLIHKAQMVETNQAFYIQKYVDKPQRDIRAFVVGSETICAVYRNSSNWITNTARGGETSNCPVTRELSDLCVRAARAVGGGVVAIDLLEDPEQGLLINEINDIMEFRNSIAPTGVDIPERVVNFALRVAQTGWKTANG